MIYTYITKGTCSKSILIVLKENNIIDSVSFMGGCQSNLSIISKMIAGKNIDEVISLFKGNPCGPRGTSCTDQLAKALEQIKSGELTED